MEKKPSIRKLHIWKSTNGNVNFLGEHDNEILKINTVLATSNVFGAQELESLKNEAAKKNIMRIVF